MFQITTLLVSVAVAADLRGEGRRLPGSCSITESISCPQWLCANALGLFFDVELFCDFPREDVVAAKVAAAEVGIVKQSATLRLHADSPIQFDEVPWTKTGEHFVNAGRVMSELEVAHTDVCTANDLWPAVTNLSVMYDNIKSAVDGFNIFTKCTKSYVQQPQMQKDDIISISTLLAYGHYSLSFEDVAHYTEDIDGGHKTLVVVVSSRKDNVIEGNYDVTVKLRDDYVKIEYSKRQNFAEVALSVACDMDCYTVATRQSVDSTILKLAYMGLYGPGSVADDNDGCFQDTSECVGYSTKELKESCSDNEECRSQKCETVHWWSWWKKHCVEQSA